MCCTTVPLRRVVGYLAVALVASTWHGARADDPTYVETTGYKEVLAAVSRLKSEGAKLSAAVREKLAAEGQSLIKLEESYKPGTRPLQQETKRSEAKSKALDDEVKALEDRRKTLEGDPNRTQAQVDAYNDARADLISRLDKHDEYVKDLNSRIDADNERLEKTYAAFVDRVNAAFSALPPAMQVSPAKLTQVISDAAESNKTDCANSVAAVASSFGIKELTGKRANLQIDFMQKNWSAITPAKAQELANQGRFVVAGRKDGGHGHVAVVVPGSVDKKYSHPKLAGGALPAEGSSTPGTAYSKEGQTVNWVWNLKKIKVSEIKYYSPK